MDLYEQIVALRQQGRRGAVATVTRVRGSAPSFLAAKMLVRDDGSIAGTVGGGRVEADVRLAALEAMRDEKPRTLTFDLSQNAGDEPGLICGGAVEIFVEPIVPPAALYILGAGHVAQQLSRIASLTGFTVIVIDDRAEFANRERHPEASRIIVEDVDAAFATLAIDDSSYVVILTRSHAEDTRALRLAIGTPARYIGMIGSRRKVSTVLGELRKEGVTTQQLDRVHAPIGLEIGAVTPEEIAVSILAELIAVRRNASADVRAKSMCPAAGEELSLEESTSEKTPL